MENDDEKDRSRSASPVSISSSDDENQASQSSQSKAQDFLKSQSKSVSVERKNRANRTKPNYVLNPDLLTQVDNLQKQLETMNNNHMDQMAIILES